MPGTGQRVREPLRHVYAIEHLAFNRVVRGKAAQEDLDDKQGNRQEGIFFQGTILTMDQTILAVEGWLSTKGSWGQLLV